MTKKTNRFYTTINEAKQLMKLSIYERWIKNKADMYYDPEGNLIIDESNGYSDEVPVWSTDALIKACNNLELMILIANDSILVERDPDSVNKDNQFDVIMDGTCLPWMLVKVLKEYDKKYGTK